jgi:hypothetical protein
MLVRGLNVAIVAFSVWFAGHIRLCDGLLDLGTLVPSSTSDVRPGQS